MPIPRCPRWPSRCGQTPRAKAASVPDEQLVRLRRQQRQPDTWRTPHDRLADRRTAAHAGRMILLDRVESFDDERILCLRTVARRTPSSSPTAGLPAWAGIELMAQAIAAWMDAAAARSRRAGPAGLPAGHAQSHCVRDYLPRHDADRASVRTASTTRTAWVRSAAASTRGPCMPKRG